MTNTSSKKQPKPTSEWTDKDWHKFRQWLVDMLKVGPMTVTFTKKDGAERVMHCTLEKDKLPPIEVKETTRTKKENLDVVSVYDLNAKGWRSFVIKNITSVSIQIGSEESE